MPIFQRLPLLLVFLVSLLPYSASQAEQGLWDRFSPFASSAAPRFLKPDQAFELLVDVPNGKTLKMHWQIAKGYYLYKDKMSFAILNTPTPSQNITLGEARYPPADIKHDETFGRSEVFHNNITVALPLLRSPPAEKQNILLQVKYQGCADKGFCYPPITKRIELSLPALAAVIPATNAQTSTGRMAAKASLVPEQTRLANSLSEGGLWGIILSFFGLGLLLSFTPCVFPMIPILSSLIVGQGDKAKNSRHTFLLSLVFVLAMSFTYTLAGIIAGLTGANLQAAFQTPWVLSLFSLFFVAMALSMFGFYALQMPSALQNRLNNFSHRFKGGQWGGVIAMGILSALIVGPCVAPPLIGALMYISQSGDAFIGGLALFAMSIGMGVPLLILGASAGKLLPKAGRWMDAVKNVFGVLLLGLAIWMLERILPAWIVLLMWSGLFIVAAVYLGVLEAAKVGWQRLWKGLGLFLLLYGIVLMLGAFTGGRDLLHPVERNVLSVNNQTAASSVTHVVFKRMTTLDELNKNIAWAQTQGLPVMLDYYADWCISCKEMEAETFNNPAVAKKLDKMVLLQADVTANDADAKALLEKFGLFGPPSILFFDRQGQEVKALRLVGFLGPEEFSRHLEQIL